MSDFESGEVINGKSFFETDSVILKISDYEKLKQENARLREALEFYSIEKDWDFYCSCCADGSTKLEKDHGKLARKALEKSE